MKYKIRWQLEHALAVIYWSIAFIALFFSLIFALEKAEIHFKSFLFLLLFLVLVYLSRKRWLMLDKNGIQVTYARFWKKDFFTYQDIKQFRFLENKIEIDLPKETLEFKVNKKMLLLFKEASKEIIPIHLQKEG